jgi:hypothetical protein
MLRVIWMGIFRPKNSDFLEILTTLYANLKILYLRNIN